MSGPFSPGEKPSRRGPEPVVVIRGGPDSTKLGLTLRSVLATTGSEVRLVIVSPRPPELDGLELAGRIVTHAGGPLALPVADVALLEAGVVMPEGWLSLLTAAAGGSARIATVSALRADVTLLEPRHEFSAAARAVARQALRLHPRLTQPSGPCVFVPRSTVQLVGAASIETENGWARFAERCLSAGLAHVLADELLVDGRQTSAGGAPELAEPVRRAHGAARRALHGLSVVIDARLPSGRRDGTWVHVLELVAALGRTGQASITAIVPDREGADPDLRARLSAMPGVAALTLAEARDRGFGWGDVVHRPFQVSAPADLAALASLAGRLIITHQDLISFHNPAYFPSPHAWKGYRDLTRRALAAADHVVFFSEHVRDDAAGENLIEPGRATVVPIGVDHVVSGYARAPVAPKGMAAVGAEAEVLLCLGADFGHKNRMFALRVMDALQRAHGWRGWLVLAGPAVAHGSSRPEEREFLGAHPGVAAKALDLGPVSDAEKLWLLRRAALVLYPTVEEGFGLIPFEAAEHERPCLWAATSALAEILPPALARVIPWDAVATADRARALMDAGTERAEVIAGVRRAGEGLRWDETAARLIALYREVCRAAPAPAAVAERAGGLMREGLSEDAMRLVGPDGSLPRELERPLLALTTHRRLARPVLGLIRAGYAASQRARRGDRRGPAGEG